MSEQEQSRVSKVVWPWSEGGRKGPDRAGPGPRVRSLVQAAVLAVAGLVLLLALRLRPLGEIVLAFAGIILVSGQLIPPLYKVIDLFGRILSRAAAAVLTWLLLAPFFLVCFVPARFILVLCGKDPLRRAFPGREKSYWLPHRPAGGVERFKRQY